MTRIIPRFILLGLIQAGLCGCAAEPQHVKNDPGGTGETGAVPNDNATHGSGALSGYPAANGDPVSSGPNLGIESTADPENGVNSNVRPFP